MRPEDTWIQSSILQSLQADDVNTANQCVFNGQHNWCYFVLTFLNEILWICQNQAKINCLTNIQQNTGGTAAKWFNSPIFYVINCWEDQSSFNNRCLRVDHESINYEQNIRIYFIMYLNYRYFSDYHRCHKDILDKGKWDN